MKIIEIANGRSDARPTDAKSVLEQRLADLEATVRRRQKDWLAARTAAAAEPQDNLAEIIIRERAARSVLERELTARRAQYERDIARANAVRAMVDEQIREAAHEVKRARQAEASAAAAVERLTRAEAEAVARLAEREAEMATELSAVMETRDGLEQQLSYVESALASARQRHELAANEVEQLTSRAADLNAQYAGEAAARATLERRLAQLEAALGEAELQHRSAMATAAARLTERQAQFETELASITRRRDSLEEQLRNVEARLTQESGAREALGQAIHTVSASAAAAEQRFRDDIAAISENASAERARLEDQLSRERREHETRLADEQQQHRSAMATAAAQLAEREAHFETEVASIAAAQDGLEQQLRAVDGALARQIDARLALERAITEQRSAAADAEQRFREDIAAMTENASAERARLEDQLTRERHEHETRLADEQQQHRSAMTTAATQLAEREAHFRTELASITATRERLEAQLRGVETQLTRETRAREGLEQAITELRAAAAAAEQRLLAEIASLAENGRAERARLEDQLSREQEDHQARLAEREAQLQAELTSLATTRATLERQLHEVESKLEGETETRERLEHAIAEAKAAAAQAERQFRDEIAALTAHASAERARLNDQLSRERRDHETRLAAEAQQHRSAMATAATRLAEREAQFRVELTSITATRDRLEEQLRDVETQLTQETGAREELEQAFAELQAEAAAAERRFLEETASLAENGRAERSRLEDQLSRERALGDERLTARGAEFEADLRRLSKLHSVALAKLQASIEEKNSRIDEQSKAAAALQTLLDASDAENRRQFEQTPVPLVRCTRDGGLAAANQAFAALIGCRTPKELRDRNVAATLFESQNDLSWLIERSANSTKTESIDTTCIRKDGVRVAVRLSARLSASGAVEIAVEDLTAIRVLEDRLREAHRMEAVGRVASEIAMTCEKLLRDVYREAQRLLTTMSGREGQRDHADTLLDDVTLAGSILHQLVAYGDEQTAALAPVDVNRILRDLQPVLKQVAGDAIALELHTTSSPVNVDVNAERVERLLVNVASYGRQRMPHGGRLRIELSTVVVDGKFIAQYPNVRQGPHALITVTEVARPAAEGQLSDHAEATESGMPSARPRVDLGALQELISECGGHLWITAEPGGSMVVRMRLPLRAAWEGQAHAGVRHGLGRVTARLFGR